MIRLVAVVMARGARPVPTMPPLLCSSLDPDAQPSLKGREHMRLEQRELGEALSRKKEQLSRNLSWRREYG